jgi:Transposase DDE domain
LERGYRLSIVLVDAGYGNNSAFLKSIEQRKLKYLGGIAKNRRVMIIDTEGKCRESRLDEIAKSLPSEDWQAVTIKNSHSKTVWVSTFNAEIKNLSGTRIFAIVMNANDFEQATDVDYFITNIDNSIVTPEWIVLTYSQRNWVEVFYRDAKCWLGLREYQVRDKNSLEKHFILVLCAYTFILWHKLTGGLARRWANQPLTTFAQALAAFRTAMSFLFFDWLVHHRDVFAAYKASLGFIWA